MQLRDIEIEIIKRCRDGMQPSAIAKELGMTASEVCSIMRHVTVLWRNWARDYVKFAAYQNILRYEMLWALVADKLKDPNNVEPRLLTIAATLIEKENRMLGLDDSLNQDASWLRNTVGNPVGAVELPKPFAMTTSSVGTESPAAGTT